MTDITPDIPPLPGDAPDLESLLARHRPAPPAPALRAAILHHAQRQSRWAFLEAMAALLLIGLTLSQIAASVTQLIPPPSTDPAHTQQLAQAIAQLDLPLTPEETTIMAQQLAAAEHLQPLPLLHANPTINISSLDGVFP